MPIFHCISQDACFPEVERLTRKRGALRSRTARLGALRRNSLRSMAATALVGLLFGSAVGAAPAVEGARLAFEPDAVRETVATLESWLDTQTDLPRSEVPLERVVFVEAGTEVRYEGRMTRVGDRIRGLYDETTATIYLVRPWFGDTARDRSVLLHELFHHRQASARHWYCGQAMEWDAYRTQEDYLNAHGTTGGFNWTWVTLVSSCSTGDHHPE